MLSLRKGKDLLKGYKVLGEEDIFLSAQGTGGGVRFGSTTSHYELKVKIPGCYAETIGIYLGMGEDALNALNFETLQKFLEEQLKYFGRNNCYRIEEIASILTKKEKSDPSLFERWKTERSKVAQKKNKKIISV